MIALRLRITGKVQGVFFRASAKEEADHLGIRGVIRNTDDGAVEALIEGDPAAVEAFTTWCADGPRGAQVTGMETAPVRPQGFAGFRIITEPLPQEYGGVAA